MYLDPKGKKKALRGPEKTARPFFGRERSNKGAQKKKTTTTKRRKKKKKKKMAMGGEKIAARSGEKKGKRAPGVEGMKRKKANLNQPGGKKIGVGKKISLTSGGEEKEKITNLK